MKGIRWLMVLCAVLAIAVAAGAGYLLGEDAGRLKAVREGDRPTVYEENITSFDECVAAGYPVMESFPEQCMTSDGRNFVNENAMPPEESTGSTLPQVPVACTMEAKICPDGSSVGRSGPNCEFAPCPGE